MERLPSKSNNLPANANTYSVVQRIKELSRLPLVQSGLTIADKSILNAFVQKPIEEYDGNEAGEKIVSMLQFIAKDVGYTPKDNNEWKYQRVRIAQIICKYYSKLSIEDVRTAFEMLAIGELDKYLPNSDRKHYGQFTSEYIGKVLNAYKERQLAAISIAYEIKQEEKPQTFTEEQEEKGKDFIRKTTCEWFKSYKENGVLPTNQIGYVSYHFFVVQTLENIGRLTRQTPTDEHRTKAYHEYMRQHTIGRVTDCDASHVRKVGIHATEIDYLARRFADYDSIRKAFSEIIEEGLKIEDII